MPRIYTLRQKQHALYLVRQYDSFSAVSQQTGIPERTLRDWHERRHTILVGKDPALDYEGGDGTITPRELRDRLLEQIEKLTRSAADDPRKAYFTALTINHLLAQIKTLNDTLDITPPPDPEEPPPSPIALHRRASRSFE